MRFSRHRPVSERALRRWLETGRPARVERRLEWDHALETRLEELTDLDAHARRAVATVTAAPDDLVTSTIDAMHRRTVPDDVATVVGDLLGLGFRTAHTLLLGSDHRDGHPRPERPDRGS